MTFNGIERGDGTIEVEIAKWKLTCAVCGHQQFHNRNSLLNTRMAALFNVH